MSLERAVVDFLEELERISLTHEEVTDTDVREDLSLAVNHCFVWGQPQKRLPRTFGMGSDEGDLLVADALRRFLNTVAEDEALSRVPCGQARLDILQAESSKTRSGMTYDVFLGHGDAPLPPEPLPKRMFEARTYNKDDEES